MTVEDGYAISREWVRQKIVAGVAWPADRQAPWGFRWRSAASCSRIEVPLRGSKTFKLTGGVS